MVIPGQASSSDHGPSIAIIGSGFSGVGLAIKFKKAGLNSFTIFEKESDAGGVWRDNHYPGAACDIPSHLYSFSFEPGHGWQRKYGQADEINQYLKYCIDKYDLKKHIQFNTEISAANFDSEKGLWNLTSQDGRQNRAKFMMCAVGQLNRPVYPRLKGLDSFSGTWFHSAKWNHEYDYKGKNIGVIGVGASAIQFVPEIVDKTRRLSVFQRSAPYVIPKADHVYLPFKKFIFKKLPFIQSMDRAYQYVSHEVRILGFNTGFFGRKIVEPFYKSFIRKAVKDKELLKKVMPGHDIGCKRILLSNEWYQTLQKQNVSLITEDIEAIVPSGIKTKDGKIHELDCIIYGTGFAATDFLAPMTITGVNKIELNKYWSQGAQAYLGLSIHNFPNMFMLYGPNTNLGHSSIIYMLESQFAYILSAIKSVQRNNVRYLNLRKRIEIDFNETLQQRLKASIWASGCSSWYQNSAGKVISNWPDFTFKYRRLCKRFDLNHYELTSND